MRTNWKCIKTNLNKADLHSINPRNFSVLQESSWKRLNTKGLSVAMRTNPFMSADSLLIFNNVMYILAACLQLLQACFVFLPDINSYSASHDNWCTATLWNRIMTAQCEGMGEVGLARYEPALLPPCPSIRALCYSNCQRSTQSHQQSKGYGK